MFSKATEYALRATIYIAQNSSEEKKVSILAISKAIDSPKSFTAKILQSLTRGNKIVSSAPGPHGGFYMTEKAKKLPARAILKAMDEDGTLDKCVLGLKQCSDASPCPMHSQYKLIKLQLKDLFESKSIQNLANELYKGSNKRSGV
jgi:Rrf2 family transcriptional regulator, iron-sulfur cluster assembly transcription factor